MRLTFYLLIVIIISFAGTTAVVGQVIIDTTTKPTEQKFNDSVYFLRYDTLLHLWSTISKNQMEYTLVYNRDLKLVLAPNSLSNLSLGFSYRFLELGIGFSPHFLNGDQNKNKTGESKTFSFRTSFSMHRFNLALDLSSVHGFYLKNSKELKVSLPDTPYLLFPDLKVGYFSMLLRYNVNPRFSTAALTGGTQVQKKSAYTLLPSFQFATFKFNNQSKATGLTTESTFSTDLNLLFPLVGTLVITPKLSATMGIGPSFGVDFFKTVARNDSGKIVVENGTKMITGYTFQTAITFNSGRFFAGIESRYRSYGHKIEDISRLIKEYSYFQLYIGWRLRAPSYAKKSADWLNKVSPVELE
jgi:uncharacterized protein DUF4421